MIKESDNGSNNQQRINNNRITALERTAAKANVDDFNNRNKYLTPQLLKQGYWHHKL